MPADTTMLTVAEVARQLRVNRATVYVLIDDKRLGVVRIGPRSIRVPVAELERFLSANCQEATA